MVVIVPDTDEKMPVEEALQVEESLSLDTENPPPYAPPQDSPQGTSLQVATLPRSGLPPNLPPTNYLHVKEKNNAIKTKILLDLSMPPPQASALPTGIHGPDMPHLILDSHNGAVSGEVWVHRPNLGDTSSGRNKDKRERARLEFRSQNGAIKALVHIHPSMAEPRPFLQIEAKGHNGSVTISIPRSFRGQLMLHTDNGRVRPDGDKWRTGTSGEGEEVDEVIGWSKNGSVKVSYDDEDLAGAGVLSSFFRAMTRGF
ncbi:hypothetical protein EDB92DRAFT_1837472 [Lactarius akahatsu]|uniref:DUF7330 domain-containing protein n=1 Tax=Lactarius akahatsu TaxID=416441 RepID=A0AAD4LMX4_9AGAM|nr:hypothetical protein EDB92DRAFT_1837472 [Lactarius akahatsu]